MLAELWRRYKHDGNFDAREELIIQCLPMVKSLAQRFAVYMSPCCGNDDLISVGIIGLLDALEKYDPVMQTSFRTYARYRVRGAILDELRNLQWMPRSIQEKIQSLKRAYTQLEQELSRPPNEEELADALDMNLHQFRKMLIQVGPPTFLTLGYRNPDSAGSDAQEITIEDPDAVDSLDYVISDEVKSILADAIGSLPERETIVISLYYYEEMTLREIGEILSLTESRVCQIHAGALLRLFQILRPKMLPEAVPAHQAAAG